MKLDTKQALALRDDALSHLMVLLDDAGHEVLPVASGAIAIKMADSPEGDELFVKVALSVPKGPKDGEGWFPREEAEIFLAETEAKAKKKAEAEAKKAEKIAKDKAKREAKQA